MTGGRSRVEQVRAGERRALASLMRDLEDAWVPARWTEARGKGAADVVNDVAGRADPRRELAALYGEGSPDLLVGVTGPPGAGKSTLVDALVTAWRATGRQVGVVAVDPSSPLTGGAILGDRVRMQRHALDPGVFIRSLASRGALGGLAAATLDVITVLAAGGFKTVIVETVGAGQAEVDVAALADLTLVITVPGLGDDVQALKAGILEIADVLVLNKADRPGADHAAAALEGMLALRGAVTASPRAAPSHTAPTDPPRADVPILRTVASLGQGIPELVSAIDEVHARDPARAIRRRHAQAVAAVKAAALAGAARFVDERIANGDEATRKLIAAVVDRRVDPDTAAAALMANQAGG